MVEKLKITGHVTVIKNKGKANEELILNNKKNLLTFPGRDFFHDVCYVLTSPPSTGGSNFVAVSNDATPITTADTILAGELTTLGMIRVLADTITHSTNSDITVISNTFTATGGAVSNIQKTGLFTEVTSGILTHAQTFTPVSLADTESITITWTLTLG